MRTTNKQGFDCTLRRCGSWAAPSSRRQIGGSLSNESISKSWSSLENIVSSTESVCNGKVLTVHQPNLPNTKTECANNVSISSERMSNEHIIDIDKEEEETPPTSTSMAPQEIAMLIDRRSRFLFPVMFLAFNALYWTYVYVS